MPDVMRYHSGDVSPVVLPTSNEHVIHVGDLVALVRGDIAVALHAIHGDDPEHTRSIACRLFAGVALQASPAGYSGPIRVATAGNFLFPQASGIYRNMDYVGPAFKGLGVDACCVAPVSRAEDAIGRVRDLLPVSLLIGIISTLLCYSGNPDAADYRLEDS